MTWIRIFSESDLEEFKEKYFAVSGFHVSVEDLQRYQVYVLKEGRSFRGGFWLIPSPPYRCLKTLSEEYLAADRAIAKAMTRPLVEMGGMWKEEAIRGKASSAGFFLGTLFAIREMPPNAWVMFGYDHQQDYLRRFYRCCDAFVLYRGPIVRPGENHGEGIHATICAVPKALILSMGFLAFTRNVGRMLSPKSRTRQPKSTPAMYRPAESQAA